MKRPAIFILLALVLVSFSLVCDAKKPKNGWIFLGPKSPDHSTSFLYPSAIDSATIETVAGTGIAGNSGDGGPALAARLNAPQDVEIHYESSLLIADTLNHLIRRVDGQTGIISTFAGNGRSGTSGNRLPATEASLASPRGLAVDGNGNVYVSTLHMIRVIDPSGIIDLFAGSVPGDAGDGVPAREAQFRTLGGLAIAPNGGILVADIMNHKIRKIRPNNIVVTIAGTGIQGGRGDNGLATQAELDNPVDVAVSPTGIIYIAERFGSRIRKIENGIITTLFDVQMDSRFTAPRGLAVFETFYLYFSSEDQRVRRMDLTDRNVSIVTGTGTPGSRGDGDAASLAELNMPVGLTLDSAGNLYIADSGNNKVRRILIPPLEVTPTPTLTHTPTITPTPTQTSGPTFTPTRTPRQRTPTPTSTPVPTATPTATPTALPEGQLAPPIPSGVSLDENYVFYTNETRVTIPSATDTGKVKVVLSSSRDGQGFLLTEDTIALSVIHASGTISNSTITFSELSNPIPPRDITELFAEGRNRVKVRLVDSKGATFSSFPLFVVIFSAPVLKDIPDIRLLVGEGVDNVYSLNDFIKDRDTPVEDISWVIEGDPEAPVILRGLNNSISLEAINRPLESDFIVKATDGIFQVTDDLHVKASTFRLQEFILPDAPLVEDFAYVSPYSLRYMVDPPDVNIADVPLEAAFETGKGLKAANVARGIVYLFPTFPGGKVIESIPVSILGKRQSNPSDFDGSVLYTASVFPPGEGDSERNYNFSAESLDVTNWQISTPTNQAGDVFLGSIPPEPIPVITDGYGAHFVVDPGETVALLSELIDLPPGPATISVWLAVEKLDGNLSDLPTITLALAEDSSNLSYTTIRRNEILGESRYQFLSTTYDVIGPKTQALIQLSGTQSSGRAEMYIDNVRVFPAERDIDRALGPTHIPVEFDGTFESVLEGLGFLFNVSQTATVGADAYLTTRANRTVLPGGFNQSLVLALNEPISAIQVEAGPNQINEEIYPRVLTASAHVQVIEEGEGFFAIGLTNGDQDAVSFISNSRLPMDPEWHRVAASGIFSQPGPIEPVIILQNENTEGAFPGVILDGATLAVDDISLDAFQDSPYLWQRKMLRSLRQ